MLVLVLIISYSCYNQTTVKQVKTPVEGVLGESAMVVTAHPLATQVGFNVLKNGGNAFDAAIAVQFALAVVYPRAGNIGGGGFLVYRLNDGTTGTLDFREKAPLAADRDMYLDDQEEVISGLSTEGHLAVGVPGSVDGMTQIHQKLGSTPFKDLVQPAIDLATEGVPLTEMESSRMNQYQEDFQKLIITIYLS